MTNMNEKHESVVVAKCTGCGKPIINTISDFGDGVWITTQSKEYDYKGHPTHHECMERTEWIVKDKIESDNKKHLHQLNGKWMNGDRDGMSEAAWEQFGRNLGAANSNRNN